MNHTSVSDNKHLTISMEDLLKIINMITLFDYCSDEKLFKVGSEIYKIIIMT